MVYQILHGVHKKNSGSNAKLGAVTINQIAINAFKYPIAIVGTRTQISTQHGLLSLCTKLCSWCAGKVALELVIESTL